MCSSDLGIPAMLNEPLRGAFAPRPRGAGPIGLMINFNIVSLLGLYSYLNSKSESVFAAKYRHILLIKAQDLKKIAILMLFYLIAIIFVLNEDNFIAVRIVSGVISGLILLVIMCLLVDSVKSLIHSNYEGADEDDSKI